MKTSNTGPGAGGKVGKAASGAMGSGSMGSGDMQVKALQGEISEMKLNMDTLEKERDFYFSKLRDIEVLM